jgi:dUTP pyrophosphatase
MQGNNVEVSIILMDGAVAPSYATEGAAGMDLRAYLPEGSIALAAGEVRLIPTGLSVAIPKGYYGAVCSRSGLSLKSDVVVNNAPGILDSDFSGTVGIILKNQGETAFIVNHGDRIAQLLILPVAHCNFRTVSSLEATARGAGGYGSTGSN